jgi:hypothetical protein
MINGTRTEAESKASLGNHDVEIPEFLIGEEGALHPVRRSTRQR